MKKSIQALVSKMNQSATGELNGGFAVLKGGKAIAPGSADNGATKCSNTQSCSGTNSNICDNSGDCRNATNSSPTNCTDSGQCFAS